MEDGVRKIDGAEVGRDLGRVAQGRVGDGLLGRVEIEIGGPKEVLIAEAYQFRAEP